MRTFLAFLALFLLAALVSGLLAYPAWSALLPLTEQPIHRVMQRLGMVILAVATIYFLRRKQLANRMALGYNLPRPIFIKQLVIGFVAGVLLIAPVIATLIALDIRSIAPLPADTGVWLVISKYVLIGLLTGLVVAFVEETFCRGAMFAAIQKESGLALAILLPTLFYAATHFLGGELRVPAQQVNYWSGIRVALDLFDRFTSPLEFVDSFAALVALGILLSLIRWRTTAIAGCIGLHAGGVCMIFITRKLTLVNPQSIHTHWVGSYDGIIGWLMLIWIALVAVVYWRVSASPANRTQ
jgi:uncharacterized protein